MNRFGASPGTRLFSIGEKKGTKLAGFVPFVVFRAIQFPPVPFVWDVWVVWVVCVVVVPFW